MIQWKVDKNPNAYREISKEEYDNSQELDGISKMPTYYNDGKYFMMDRECYTLIYLCAICISIPEITRDNYRDVHRRISIHEKLFGASMYDYNPKKDIKTERFFTLETIKKHIGIKTKSEWLDSKDWACTIIENIEKGIKDMK